MYLSWQKRRKNDKQFFKMIGKHFTSEEVRTQHTLIPSSHAHRSDGLFACRLVCLLSDQVQAGGCGSDEPKPLEEDPSLQAQEEANGHQGSEPRPQQGLGTTRRSRTLRRGELPK